MFFRLSAIVLFVVVFVLPAQANDLPGHFVPFDPPNDFPPLVFEDGHGQSLTMADFKGRPVLFNLWASWCGPCVQEMPSLDRLQGLLADQHLAVIALDQERDGAEVAAAFFKRHAIKNLGLYNDPTGRISSTLHARGLPISFLIDASGKCLGYVMGGTDWSAPEMLAFLRERLSASSRRPEQNFL